MLFDASLVPFRGSPGILVLFGVLLVLFWGAFFWCFLVLFWCPFLHPLWSSPRPLAGALRFIRSPPGDRTRRWFWRKSIKKTSKKASKNTLLNAIDRTAEIRKCALLCTFWWFLMLFGAFRCFWRLPPVAPSGQHGTAGIFSAFWCFFDAFGHLLFDCEPELNSIYSDLRQGLNSRRAGTARLELALYARGTSKVVIFGAFWWLLLKSYSTFQQKCNCFTCRISKACSEVHKCAQNVHFLSTFEHICALPPVAPRVLTGTARQGWKDS